MRPLLPCFHFKSKAAPFSAFWFLKNGATTAGKRGLT
jgi:hypothetical protein